ncbi:hypothetical protein [Noviherbaspirillum massiliense]|uniref:hypothetical protein n=1 Tax=Noviherbaspirillum massiliense TaxID=1465823 RepID=UPI0011DE1A8A|nr:hypothetical protein [Noviherbaspirillum massiliense]
MTVTKDGKNVTVRSERIHYGGPFGSEACLTSVDSNFIGASGKKGFENFIREQLPSLNSGGKEGTFIQLPARDWWPYYNDKNN